MVKQEGSAHGIARAPMPLKLEAVLEANLGESESDFRRENCANVSDLAAEEEKPVITPAHRIARAPMPIKFEAASDSTNGGFGNAIGQEATNDVGNNTCASTLASIDSSLDNCETMESM